MQGNKKLLLYTTVVAGSHYKTKLFDVDAWKKIGFDKSWCSLLNELQASANTPPCVVTNALALAVDDLEEYLENHENAVELLGAGEKDPPPVTDIPTIYLIRLLITFLLDRVYHAHSPNESFDHGNEICLYQHPQLILHQKALKHTTTGGQYLSWSIERLHQTLDEYINLSNLVQTMVPHRTFDKLHPTGNITELPSNVELQNTQNTDNMDQLDLESTPMDLDEHDKTISCV